MRLLVLLALLGCERADKDVPRTKQVTLETPHVEVKLVDPGVEPRSVLRYRDGQLPQSATFETRFELGFRVPGQQPQVEPTTIIREQRMYSDRRADGAVRERATVLDIVYEPAGPLDAARQRFLWLRGSSTEQWLDDRGRILGDATAIVDDRLESFDYDSEMTQFVMVFPEEPVGVGAVWEIDARTRDGHATIRVSYTGRTGELVKVESHVDYENRRMHLRSTGQGDFVLHLAGLDASGSYAERGTMLWDGQQVIREATTTTRRVP